MKLIIDLDPTLNRHRALVAGNAVNIALVEGEILGSGVIDGFKKDGRASSRMVVSPQEVAD